MWTVGPLTVVLLLALTSQSDGATIPPGWPQIPGAGSLYPTTTAAPTPQTTQSISGSSVTPGYDPTTTPSFGSVSGSISGSGSTSATSGMDIQAMLNMLGYNMGPTIPAPTSSGATAGSSTSGTSGTSGSSLMDSVYASLFNSQAGSTSALTSGTGSLSLTGSGPVPDPFAANLLNMVQSTPSPLAVGTGSNTLSIGGPIIGNDPSATNILGSGGLGPAPTGPGSLLDSIFSGGSQQPYNTQQQQRPQTLRSGFDMRQLIQLMLFMSMFGEV